MILSVSRRTDIPAFYSDWFFSRLYEGVVYVRNPIRRDHISSISTRPDVVDCIVFWSKDPAPMLPRLNELEGYSYYFQFTVNAYGTDMEPGVPPLEKRLDTFRELAEKLGKERVIWRYDPIFFTEGKYDVQFHLDQFARIAGELKGYTEKCVFSFLDVYPGLGELNVSPFPKEEEWETFLGGLTSVASEPGLSLATCAEKVDLEHWGIQHNSCIDQSLIERITGAKLRVKRDGQRPHCRCVQCIDVGSYNTCQHGCTYCYAGGGSPAATGAWAKYDPASPLLCDSVDPAMDTVHERKVESFKYLQMDDGSLQMTLF